jgi:hypothetical protein
LISMRRPANLLNIKFKRTVRESMKLIIEIESPK